MAEEEDYIQQKVIGSFECHLGLFLVKYLQRQETAIKDRGGPPPSDANTL